MTKRKMQSVIVSIIHNDCIASLIAHHYPMHLQDAISGDHSFADTFGQYIDEK